MYIQEIGERGTLQGYISRQKRRAVSTIRGDCRIAEAQLGITSRLPLQPPCPPHSSCRKLLLQICSIRTKRRRIAAARRRKKEPLIRALSGEQADYRRWKCGRSSLPAPVKRACAAKSKKIAAIKREIAGFDREDKRLQKDIRDLTNQHIKQCGAVPSGIWTAKRARIGTGTCRRSFPC